MALTVEQIDDLVATTQRELSKGKASQLAQTFQEYEVLPKWFRDDKVVVKGGTAIERRIVDRLPNAARHVTIDETDNPSIPQLMDKMVIPWRHVETKWAYYYEEVLMNSGDKEILDLVKTREDMAMVELAEELENKAWTCPATSNETDPYGIPYWIVKNSSTGFNGGAPNSGTTIAGLTQADHTNFKNYTVAYTTVSASDLIRKLRTAMDQTAFKSPIGKEEFYGMKGKNWRLYTNLETKLSIEDVAVAQNESLGRDVASMDNVTTIRGNALIRSVPLDSDTSNPIYGINHNTFVPVVLAGAVFRNSGVKDIPTNHRGKVIYKDTTYNYACWNRRHNFIAYVA